MINILAIWKLIQKNKGEESDFMKAKALIFLHMILIMYSICGIFSKLAGMQEFGSVCFFIYYGIELLILFLYTIFWQQIIKILPLTLMFANKAITIIWGIVFGMVIFGEKLTLGKIIGSVLIILGIIFYTKCNNSEKEYENA